MKYGKTKQETDAEAVIRLKKDNEELLKVLKFYAHKDTYKLIDGISKKKFMWIETDKGKKARDIIEKIENRRKENE